MPTNEENLLLGLKTIYVTIRCCECDDPKFIEMIFDMIKKAVGEKQYNEWKEHYDTLLG